LPTKRLIGDHGFQKMETGAPEPSPSER